MATSARGRQEKVLIVDDEWDSAVVRTVASRLNEEGWETLVVAPEPGVTMADDFEDEALYAIETERPDGVLLDVRFGEFEGERFKGLDILRKIVDQYPKLPVLMTERPDGVLLDVRFGEFEGERFKGLDILRKIVDQYPKLPVLMFTQYAQGPDRDFAVRGSLNVDAPVDFIDKMASPEEVVLRLRRLLGTAPETIAISDRLSVDVRAKLVYVVEDDEPAPVQDIVGMKFEILRELASAWYRSPGELVQFDRLERFSEGEDARASLRVRIREIKDSLGKALGTRFGAGDFSINVRDQGYRLIPPKS